VIIGFHAPFPPARTGVADYAASLLPALRRYGFVLVSPSRADLNLYHIGNNQLHRPIYELALAEPGVIVLHDAVLHHFLLGYLSPREYIEEFVFNYGEWLRPLAGELWRARAASATDRRYFQYAMLRRLVERSRAVIVHNPAAARIVAEHVRDAKVVEVPHLFAPPPVPSAAEAIRFRQRLGIPPQAFLFGVFGYLRESKRPLPILRAFQAVRQVCAKADLLVAGEFVSRDLERAAEPLLRTPGVHRLPYLSERDFWRAASAVDACINLREPAAGETSGIVIRLMGIGKPVLVSDGLETSRFPETACIRIAHGPAEHESLIHHMILLTSRIGVANEVGLRGAAYIASHHSVDQAAEQYWKVLCAVHA